MSHNMLEEIDKMYNKFCLKHRCQNKHFIQFIKLESPQYNSFNDFLIAKQNNSRLLIIVKNNLTDNFFYEYNSAYLFIRYGYNRNNTEK